MSIFLFCTTMIVGYLLGSVNFSLIVSRYYNVDIREHGSGNAGATNTLRVLGKRAAFITTAGDVAKGIVAYVLGGLLLPEPLSELGGLAAGCAAVVGHNWPIYFRFRGGKGIWTSFAVAISFDWQVGVLLLLSFAIVLYCSRMVSLSAIIASLLLPLFTYLLSRDQAATMIFAGLSLLAIFRHRSNLKRIRDGNEPRIGERKT